MRRITCIFGLTSLYIILFGSTVLAQFATLYTAPSNIRSVYVMDKEGLPNTIFVGYTGGISYSRDGGVTWTASSFNDLDGDFDETLNGDVTCFTFKDKKTGWVSISPNPIEGLFQTTDSGATWNPVPLPLKNGNAVYYHKPNGKLFFSSLTDSIAVSTDLGATFKAFGGKDFTGFAFSNDLTGLVTTENSKPYLATIDGGTTWTPVGEIFPSWQPYGLPGTSTFFASLLNQHVVVRSDDGGKTWRTVPNAFNGQQVLPTGVIEGDTCGIFSSTNAEVFFSTDQGHNWGQTTMIANLAKVRFAVSGKPNNLLYVASNNNLEVTARPTPAVLAMPDTVIINSVSCLGTDTSIRLYSCDCSGPLMLQSASLVGGTRFQLQPISPGGFCGAKNLQVHFTPSDVPYQDTILLHFTNGGTSIDTSIILSGPALPLAVQITPGSVTTQRAQSCQSADTIITITNPFCTTISVTNATLSGDPEYRMTNPGFPVTLGPGQSVSIPVFARPAQAGNYGTLLTVHIHGNAGDTSIDIPFTLLVSKTAKADYHSFNLNLKDYCSLHDTAIYVVNTLCDTLFINNVMLTDQVHFAVVGLNFPAAIPPNMPFRIVIRTLATQAGNYLAKAIIYATMNGAELDSTVAFSVNLRQTLTLAAEQNLPKLDFGLTNSCNPRQASIVIKDNLCFPLDIVSITPTFSSGDFSVIHQPAVPSTLQIGQTDSFVVRFAPTSSTQQSGSFAIRYRSGSVTKDTIIFVRGVGTTSASAALKDSVLKFDSIYSCDASTDLTTTLRNESCVDATISGFRFNRGNYVVLAPPIGTVVPHGQTVQVTIHLRNRSIGMITDSLEVDLTDAFHDMISPALLALDAFIRPPIRMYTITPDTIRLDSVACNSSYSYMVTLSNHGKCDTLNVAVVSANQQEISVTQVNKPSISPDSKDSFQVNITLSNSNPINARVNIRGANVDTSMVILATVKPCGSGSNISLALDAHDSLFLTSNCTTRTDTFYFVNSGDPVSIDQVSFMNPQPSQTKFTFVNRPNFPYALATNAKLPIVVTYNPDGTGSNTIDLSFQSVSGKISKVVTLTGKAIGAHFNAKLGLDLGTPGLNQMSGKATDVVTTNIVARNLIHDSLAMRQTHFHIFYDPNVLTKINLTQGAGWTIVNDGGTEGQLDIVMSHAAGTVNPGDVIATIQSKISVSDSDHTPITLDQVSFNESDANYARCKLSGSSANDTLLVNVKYSCTDSLLVEKLRNNLVITNLGILPNPVTGRGSSARVRLDLLRSSHISIDLISMSGVTVKNIATGEFVKGEHNIPLDTEGLSEGTYLVVVHAGNTARSRKFIVTRQ